MKLYLSSFRTGNETTKLVEMSKSTNKRVAFISNAMDYFTDLELRKVIEGHDIGDLEELGFEVEHFDLRDFFMKEAELEDRIKNYDIIWCVGGNTFVLKQAMQLSGLDKIIVERFKEKTNTIYGGFSAGASIAAKSLKGIHIMDNPDERTYGEQYETPWSGLGLIDYMIVPHYKSEQFEDLSADKVVEYLINEKILFKVLEDGEVIVIE